MEYPVFYNTHNGKPFPMARYYKKTVLTLKDLQYYFERNPYSKKSNVIIEEHKPLEQILTKERQFQEKQQLIENTDFTNNFNN